MLKRLSILTFFTTFSTSNFAQTTSSTTPITIQRLTLELNSLEMFHHRMKEIARLYSIHHIYVENLNDNIDQASSAADKIEEIINRLSRETIQYLQQNKYSTPGFYFSSNQVERIDSPYFDLNLPTSELLSQIEHKILNERLSNGEEKRIAKISGLDEIIKTCVLDCNITKKYSVEVIFSTKIKTEELVDISNRTIAMLQLPEVISSIKNHPSLQYLRITPDENADKFKIRDHHRTITLSFSDLNSSEPYLAKIINTHAEKVNKLISMNQKIKYIFNEPDYFNFPDQSLDSAVKIMPEILQAISQFSSEKEDIIYTLDNCKGSNGFRSTIYFKFKHCLQDSDEEIRNSFTAFSENTALKQKETELENLYKDNNINITSSLYSRTFPDKKFLQFLEQQKDEIFALASEAHNKFSSIDSKIVIHLYNKNHISADSRQFEDQFSRQISIIIDFNDLQGFKALMQE